MCIGKTNNIGSGLFRGYQKILLTVNLVSLRHTIFTTFCTHRHPYQNNLDVVHNMIIGAMRVLRNAVGVRFYWGKALRRCTVSTLLAFLVMYAPNITKNALRGVVGCPMSRKIGLRNT